MRYQPIRAGSASAESKAIAVMTPTSAFPSSALPRSVANEAGTILHNNGPRAVPVVLADFQRVVMSPLCPQDELKQIQVHFMSIAQSAKRGLKTEDERLALSQTIRERMARLAHRPNTSRIVKSAF